LTWSVRPWWGLSNWCIAGGAFAVIGGFFGLLAALRPDFSRSVPALDDTITIRWKHSIMALVLGSGVVLTHWMFVVAADDFVVVRPYKSGFAEVNMGSVIADGKALVIPMPDGSREVVSEGAIVGYKVFEYGFPISYRTSNAQLPMCTPAWQVPIRIALNVAFFAAISFIVLAGFSLMKHVRSHERISARRFG
jgi:hypothetical protein